MEATREEVLKGWLKLSMAINNERLVSGLPYNEFLICGILYRNQKSEKPEELTATDLCNSERDKRQLYVTFRMERAESYEREHERILKFVDELMNRIGWDRSEEIVKLFDLIANMADEVIG